MGRLIKIVRSRESEVGSEKKISSCSIPLNLRLVKLSKIKMQGSIVEPVIAVVILVITMAMAFTILTRTNITPIVQAKNRANELISLEIFHTINESDFINKEEQIGAFKIVKNVEQIQNGSTINIKIQVFDLKQKEIMKKDILIAKPISFLTE